MQGGAEEGAVCCNEMGFGRQDHDSNDADDDDDDERSASSTTFKCNSQASVNATVPEDGEEKPSSEIKIFPQRNVRFAVGGV